jgi:hypothetical protein
MDEAKKNYRVVYTIVQRQRTGRKHWVRIGAAFTNRDGSVNVQLDAVPTNGQLQIRDYRPFTERADAKDSTQDSDFELPTEALAS